MPKGGRPSLPMGARKSVMITLRTTMAIKAMAEDQARAQDRSLSNYLECLIRNGYREGLARRRAYRAVEEDLRNVAAAPTAEP